MAGAPEPGSLIPEKIRDATRDLLALVDATARALLSGEPLWRSTLTAMVARMPGTLDSMAVLELHRQTTATLARLREKSYSVAQCSLARSSVRWTQRSAVRA